MDQSNLIDRINAILENRSIYAWVQSFGATNGVAESLKKNTMPRGDILTLIGRVENVSLNWLTAGKGRPFLIGKHVRPIQFAYAIRAHLEDDPNWHVSVVSCDYYPDETVVIFEAPAQVDYKGKAVDYTLIELECGGWNQDVAKELKKAKNVTCYSLGDSKLATNKIMFNMLKSGRMGTYLIHRFFKNLRPVDPSLVLDRPTVERPIRYEVRESGPADLIDLSKMRQVIDAVKTAAEEEGRQLSNAQFSSAVASLYRRLEPGAHIDQNVVKIAIDSAQALGAAE